MRPVSILGARSISRMGRRGGLGQALVEGVAPPGYTAAPPQSPKTLKMMSPAAQLAWTCLADLLFLVEWKDHREELGYFLGVGASGGSMADVTPMLEATIVDGTYSQQRFGTAGLAACNPLLAFQLMNNFTMAHGAILEGIGGPNGALFSRGAGTIAAIAEAVHAVASGDCDRAVAGGADAATHPVTVAELARDGHIARGLDPADGAGMLAFTSSPERVVVEGCAIASGRGRPAHDAIDEALARGRIELTAIDTVVIAPWGPPAADALRSWLGSKLPGVEVVDTSPLGESLAASAALAVVAGADLVDDRRRRVLVLTLGVDGDPGVVLLARGAR